MIKVEKFTSGTAQTWTKEPWAEMIRVVLIGGGGPGGGGAKRIAASTATGGGGGGGASVIDRTYAASQLASSETYTVAAQRVGGAGATTNDTAGAQGSQGDNTTMTINGVTLTAYGGGAGSAGNAVAGNIAGGGGAGLDGA